LFSPHGKKNQKSPAKKPKQQKKKMTKTKTMQATWWGWGFGWVVKRGERPPPLRSRGGRLTPTKWGRERSTIKGGKKSNHLQGNLDKIRGVEQQPWKKNGGQFFSRKKFFLKEKKGEKGGKPLFWVA